VLFTALPNTAICNEGWIPYGDSCYKISDDKATWLEAEAKCQQLGNDVHLASCMKEHEIFFLAKQKRNASEAFYLGITDL
jgi:hypothetical protein